MKHIITVTLATTFLSANAATLVVNNDAQNAADTNPGTPEKPFKTINAAAQSARPGDTVLVCAGTYRERVAPANSGTPQAPVTYMAAPGEHVEVKGSEPWSNAWRADANTPRVFHSPVDTAWFNDDIPNPYTIGISIAGSDKKIKARPVAADKTTLPWPRTLGQIFLNGEPLTQVQTMDLMRAMEGSWIVSADGSEIFIHLPGTESPDILLPAIEWSVRNRIFAPRRRGLEHIHVKGFIFLHCANQGPFPQGGAVSTRTGRNWVIEQNTIRFAKTIGLDIGSETWDAAKLDATDDADRRLMVHAGHLVRANTISDNGLCGIAGWNSPGVRILGNLLERNNRLGFSHADADWEEWAAIKLHNSNALIAGNTIRFNQAQGIWIDNGYDLSRITGNLLVDNLRAGIMLELGAGSALIDNNIITGARSDLGFYDGNAVYAHDASGLTVVHNLLFGNEGAGVLMRTITARTYAGRPVATSGTLIRNNIIGRNANGAICMPFENPRSSGNASDWNLFLDTPSFRLNKYQDTFDWDDVLKKIRAQIPGANLEPAGNEFRRLGLDAWRAATGWDTHSTTIEKSGFTILPYRMLMRINATDEMCALHVPAVDEMTLDFQGTPMLSDALLDDLEKLRVRPGPLQNLQPGKSKISLVPYRHPEPTSCRTDMKTRTAQAAAKKISRLQGAVKPRQNTAPKTYSLQDAALWFTGTQDSDNPVPATPPTNRADAPATTLHTQSRKGVTSSPAQCLFFNIPESGHYDIQLSALLEKRGSASAGFTRAELHLLDPDFTAAKQLWQAELNTPDGYRGNELPARANFRQTVALPQGCHLMLRFQVVAPGPAPAGNATLRIEDFTLTLQ